MSSERRRDSQTSSRPKTNGHSKDDAHHVISTDDDEDEQESESGGYIVVASSSKKRKRKGSDSSEESASTTRTSGPTKPFSYKIKGVIKRSASASARQDRGSPVQEEDASQKKHHKRRHEDEDSEEDSVVVTASSTSSRRSDPRPEHRRASASSSRPTPPRQNSKHGYNGRAETSDTESASSSRRHSKVNGHAPLSRTSSRASNGQPPSHPRVESLTRQESNERVAHKKDKGKEREKRYSEVATNGSAPARTNGHTRTPSPDKVRHRSSHAHTHVHAGPSSQAAAPGTPSGKEKRLQQQLVQAKLRQEEWEDRFNEVSDAVAKWQERATIAEQDLTRIKRSHNDEISALRRRGDASGEGVRSAQRALEEKDNAILQLKAENDKAVISLRTEITKLRERYALALQAKENAIVANEKVTYEVRTEYEAKLAEADRQHRRQIDGMHETVQYHKTDPKLAAKEREMERIHRQHQKQLDEVVSKYNNLKEHYNRERAFWGGQEHPNGGENGWSSQVPGGSQLPDDVQQLQAQVRRLTKRQEDYPSYIEAQKDAYEGRIRALMHAEAKTTEHINANLTAIETARATLETKNELFRSRLKNAEEERDQLAEELKFVRNIRPEIEKLRKENPTLTTTNKDLVELRDQLTKENTQLRSERHMYVDRMAKSTADLHANSAELEELRLFKRKSQNALQQMKADKESLKVEKQKAKKDHSKLTKRVQKLEKMLRERQAGAVEGDDVDAEHESMDGESSMDEDPLDDPVRSREGSQSLFGPLSPRGDPMRFSPDAMGARSPSPAIPPPPTNPFTANLRAKANELLEITTAGFERYEATKPTYEFPAPLRERKANTKVPKHRTRIYVRSECHTPYVPEENVSDSDDEFLEWESQAYARAQARNPDRKAAVVNVCWNRHILDARGTRVRSHNLQFCTAFVRTYGQLISSRQAGDALLKHILQLVKLGQLTSDEGSSVVKAYQRAT